jgi:hypothetical protein
MFAFYKPYFFNERTMFFSHNKSANSTFSHNLSAKRTDGKQRWCATSAEKKKIWCATCYPKASSSSPHAHHSSQAASEAGRGSHQTSQLRPQPNWCRAVSSPLLSRLRLIPSPPCNALLLLPSHMTCAAPRSHPCLVTRTPPRTSVEALLSLAPLRGLESTVGSG